MSARGRLQMKIVVNSHVNPSRISFATRRVFEAANAGLVVVALGQVWRWHDGMEMTVILLHDLPRAGLQVLLRGANDFRVEIFEDGLRDQFTFVRAGTPAELAALATVQADLELDPRAAVNCRCEPIPLEPPQCCRCSSPATVPSVPELRRGPLCVYCAHATAYGARDPAEQDALVSSSAYGERENVDARSKRDANDRRLRPTSTASSRELAKAHPWEGEEP